jgi:uncharacterized protein
MVPFRSIVLALVAAALLAQAASGDTVLTVLPASRLARDVTVYRAGVEQARFTATGSHEAALPCSYAPGVTEKLEVRITSLEPAPPADCRQVDPAQVRQIASEGRSEKVQFVDTLQAEVPGTAGLGPTVLPDGRQASVARVFMTSGGLICMLPADGAAAARPGASVRVWGTAFGGPRGAAVLVEGLRAEPADALTDEPPWQVSATWAGREVLSVAKPGDQDLRLPCTQVAGAVERVGVRVREFRVASIQVDGHAVSVELATTPQAMSYGLQGRARLAPDSGMLFCFPEPGTPQFVMKTVSFPLSIAFIRADGVITNIERLNPGDGRYAAPAVPVSYALEMAQGWFQQHGVMAGRRVVFP